jgi:hypothetical protein
MVSMQRHGVDLNETPGRLEFPHPVEEEEAQAQDVAPGASSRDGDVGRRGVGVSLKMENPAEKRPLPLPYLLLPEIGKLAKEMVRNGEEKVAVAVGAYNSVRANALSHHNKYYFATTTTTSSCPAGALAGADVSRSSA